MSLKSNIKLSNERVENARKSAAKCLNMLETASQEMKWACEAEGWNDEVAYQLDEAALRLGFALATLTTWNDDPGEDNG